MSLTLDDFLKKHMKKGGRFVPARLQAALALLEKLRDKASLNLQDHLASKGSSGLESHETFGDRAHKRWGLKPINKNHGRRSSSLQDWGQDLLDMLKKTGFATAEPKKHRRLIDQAQTPFVDALRSILEQKPLEIRLVGHSAESVIRELLTQAEAIGKTGDVAQYLLGAKLMLRRKQDIPAYPANKADRKSWSDQQPRYGDFELENDIFEVAVGLPDEKHIRQVVDALENTDCDIWLLTRAERVPIWKVELEKTKGVDFRRVHVKSVESFIGQNIAELGDFSAKAKREKIRQLVNLYNTRWVEQVGTPGMRILIK